MSLFASIMAPIKFVLTKVDGNLGDAAARQGFSKFQRDQKIVFTSFATDFIDPGKIALERCYTEI